MQIATETYFYLKYILHTTSITGAHKNHHIVHDDDWWQYTYGLWSEHIYPYLEYIEFIDWYAWSGNANKWIENHLDNSNTATLNQSNQYWLLSVHFIHISVNILYKTKRICRQYFIKKYDLWVEVVYGVWFTYAKAIPNWFFLSVHESE